MTRVLVCGGRDYRDRVRVFEALDRLHAERKISVVIEGGQRTRDPKTREIVGGADYWGNRWADWRCISFTTMWADWRTYGAAAGPIRNQLMIDKGRPDLVVAFPGGRGTADCVARARAAGIEVVEIGG
jgi:hypothetical protein